MRSQKWSYMMQGCHTPPPPPPHPMVSLLACQVGSCLVPRLVLFGLVPSPPPPVEWGPWPFWLALPRSTDVWYGCCRRYVIVTCLVPSPPCGWGLWSFWLARPRLCGAVCSTKICMVWLLPLVSSNVIVTCSLPYKIALFSYGAPVPALMRFILHRPLPLVCVGSFRLCGTAGGSGAGGTGAGGREGGGGYHGGGGV